MLLFQTILQGKETPRLEPFCVRPAVITRLRGGPLGPSLDDLATILHQHRYAPDSIRGYRRTSDRFGRWLSQQGYAIAAMDDTLGKLYVGGLQRRPAGRWPKAAEGLSHLLRFLRQQAILPPRPAPPSPTTADQWLIRYALYLEQVCGAASSTRTRYLRIAKRFLTRRFSTGPLAWSAWQAEAIARFVRQDAATKHHAGRKMPGVAVRALLRFLVFCGERRPGWEAAVPTPRQWTHATLPQRLTAEEVEPVLAMYTGGRPKDRRNHAILMLLARLGLRAHDVASLRLADLDWRAGRVVIRPGKTHHARVFPLSSDVGRTVAASLCQGRPTTTHRRVFLHCRAPFAPFADAAAISRIATRALRAGVTGRPRLGAHTFRHTAASQMVNRGASFKDVAAVLGHQSLQTTGIYAKLDLGGVQGGGLALGRSGLMRTCLLHLHLEAYLGVREALGFPMRAERTLLRDCVGCVETHGAPGPLRAQLAVEWACTSSVQRGPGGAAQRLSMARGFLTYLRAILPDTAVPARGLVAAFRRPKPYLLTSQQIADLIQAAQNAGPPGSLRPHTFSTLLGVLASTGLRVGEAIRLTMPDVQLEASPPVFHLRETKFHKARMVLLHPTTAVQLRRYLALRATFRCDAVSDVVFRSEQGHPLPYHAMGRRFAQRCRQLGLEPTDGERRPSPHALRHAFAIARSRRWYHEGADVQALWPHLSVYLGHVRPQESYWYLTATPDLLTAAAVRFQRYAARGETL